MEKPPTRQNDQPRPTPQNRDVSILLPAVFTRPRPVAEVKGFGRRPSDPTARLSRSGHLPSRTLLVRPVFAETVSEALHAIRLRIKIRAYFSCPGIELLNIRYTFFSIYLSSLRSAANRIRIAGA